MRRSVSTRAEQAQKAPSTGEKASKLHTHYAVGHILVAL
jgi:hypothetical protein